MRAIGGIFSSLPRRTSRAYNSVIIQLLAAVVCAHIVRSALRSSSQLQSSGDATGMVIARRMYFLRQHCGQYVASPSFFQPVGVRASPLGVGLTARDIEQPAQVMVIGRVSIIEQGGTSVA